MREQNQLWDELREAYESKKSFLDYMLKRIKYGGASKEEYGSLVGVYCSTILPAYSFGKDLEYIERLFNEAAAAFIKSEGRKPPKAIFRYGDYQMLFSLAILFEYPREKFLMLVDTWDKAKKAGIPGLKEIPESNFLIDTMIAFHVTDRKICDAVYAPMKYQGLVDAIKEKDAETQIKKFKSFILEGWFEGVKAYSLGGGRDHLNIGYLFFGYWCFEAAAVAKILDLPLVEKEMGPYFPYSFFGLKEAAPKKNNRCLPKTRIVQVLEEAGYQIRIPDEWKLASENGFYAVSSDNTVHMAIEYSLRDSYKIARPDLSEFFDQLMEEFEASRPWLTRRGDCYEKYLPPTKHGGKQYWIAEYEGRPPDSDKDYRYFFACHLIDKLVMKCVFQGPKRGLGKQLPLFRHILGTRSKKWEFYKMHDVHMELPSDWRHDYHAKPFKAKSNDSFITFEARFFGSKGGAFRRFCKDMIDKIETEKTWLKSVDQSFCLDETSDAQGNKLMHLIQEFEGIAPEDKWPTRYVVLCSQVGTTLILSEFSGYSDEINEVRDKIDHVRTSLRYFSPNQMA